MEKVQRSNHRILCVQYHTMAFDHPVEADRVDLSLASIMSRAPVIGSLMYLLGGQHAREEEAYVVDAALNENLDTANSQDAAPNQKPIKSALKKSSPSLAPTEDSDNESFLSATDTSERASGTSDDDSCFRRKKKELSWSDESGQNLVEYMDALEVSSNSRLRRLECGHSGRWYLFVPKRAICPCHGDCSSLVVFGADFRLRSSPSSFE